MKQNNYSISKLWRFLLMVGVLSAGIGSASAQLTGTKNIPGDYPTLAAAITDLNTFSVGAGGVTLNMVAGNPETAPAGGYSINVTGTLANPITITGNNNVITANAGLTAGSVTDAVFKIIGGDYITIQGFNIQENAANTTTALATNNMVEFGLALFYNTVTDGAQNNTIAGNTISLSAAYPNTVGIYSNSTVNAAGTVANATSSAGTNSNNKIYSNNISNVAFGVIFAAPAATSTVAETGNDIGGGFVGYGNTIVFGNNTAATATYNNTSATCSGIQTRNNVGISARYNNIGTTAGLTAAAVGVNISHSSTPSGVTYTQTASFNKITMTNVGTTAMTGIDFGAGMSTGTLIASSDTIVLNQTTSATSLAAVIGIKANYASATNTASTNTITINQLANTGTVSSAVTALTIGGAGATGTANGNSITINQNSSGTAALSGGIVAIGGSASYTTSLNAQSNTILLAQTTSVASGITAFFTGIQFTTATPTLNVGGAGTGNTITVKQDYTGSGTYGAGSTTYIDFGSATHGTANALNNTLNTTGSTIRSTGTMIGLQCNGTVSSLYNIKSNTINIDRVAASGATYGLYTSTSPSDVNDTISLNSVTFTNISGTSTVVGLNSQGGVSSTGSNKNINNNVVNISGTNTGTSKGIVTGYSLGNILGNTVTISNASTALTLIDASGSGVGAYTINGNTLSGTSSGVSPTMIGIAGGSTGPFQIFNNTISTLNATATSTSAPSLTGIAVSVGTSNAIYGNTIGNLQAAAGSGSAAITGISVTGGTTTNIYKNRIADLSSANTGTNTIISGIRISAGTTVNVYNNLIANLSVTAASSADAIRGINITSTTATSTINLYYNTVFLQASSSGTNFGTAALYHTSNATATTAALTIRNNIFVNKSTAAGTGFSIAYRRSSSTLTNYAAASNNNIFYAGTPSLVNLIAYDGTNSDSTMSQFKARYATREAASASENVPFLSTTTGNANFLKISTSTATQVESGATPVSSPVSITDDYAGTTRNSTTPDIGAYEGNYLLQDLTAPSFGYTDLGNSASTTTRVLSGFATITDATGVNVNPGTRPRIYYKKTTESNTYVANNSASNGWKYAEATNSSSPFSFIIDYSLLYSAAAIGDTIQYVLVAQDTSGAVNVGLSNGTFAATPTSVALTSAAFPLSGMIKTYRIVATLSGVVTVGTGGTYTSLTNAGGLFDDITNGREVTGNITAQIISDISGETGTYSLGQFAPAYGLSIVPSAATVRSITGSPSIMIPIAGADNVTIDGRFSGSGNYLSFSNTGTGTTSVILFVAPTAGNGTQNLSVRNCTFINGSIDAGTTANVNCIHIQGDGHSNMSVLSNIFKKATTGIIIGAGSVTTPYTGVVISGNTFGDTLSNVLTGYGIRLFYSKSAQITNNTFKNLTTALAMNNMNIDVNTGSDSAIVSNNIIYGGRSSNSGGWGTSGVSVTVANAALITNNVIYDMNATSYNLNSTDDLYGIRIISGNNHRIYNNSVNLTGTLIASSGTTYVSAAIGLVGGTGHDIRNNNLYNSVTGVSGIKSFAITKAAAATFSTINYNNYYAEGTNAVLASYDGTDKATLAAWAASTTQDAASVSISPAYTSATNLVPNSCNYNNKGQVLAAVPTDLNGMSRGATPDIGAYEFTPAAIAAPTANNVSYCQNATATALSATGVNTLLWFGAANGGAGNTVAPTPLTSGVGTTSYYVADSSISTGCISPRTQVVVTVTAPVATNTLSGVQTICSGTAPTALTGSTATGGNGSTYKFRWLKSNTDSLSGFAVAGGNDSAQNYTSAALTQSTWFRRAVTSGACATDTAAAVKVTVTNAVTTNSITSSPQSICTGSTPTALTGSTPTGGDGTTYTYSWLSSTTSATSGFAVASGTTSGQGYTPAALTQSTWYKRVVTSGACAKDTTAAVKITVTNAIATNSITSSPQTICSGSTPTALTGSTPTGGDGSTYTYSWLSSATSATAGFAVASGTATNQGYTPSALTTSTWYRRVVTSGACANDTTAAVKITVTNAIATNSITSSPQTICSGSTPTALTGSTPTGGDGTTYTYSWLSSTTSATTGFAVASGTTNAQGYTPASLSVSTWYRRIVASGACANDTTAAVKITVTNAIASNSITSSPQTICSGSTPTALTGSTPTGGDGSTYTYSWLSSTTSATSGFAVASGTTTAQGYTPASLSVSTWFRRVVTSGACANDTAAAVKITVTNAITGNSITSSPQTICSGSTPTALTGSTPTGGDGTTYTYSWLSSTTSATSGFAVASGTTTAQGYTPAALTQSTWYRRVVASGACANDTTAAVKVTVNVAITGNSITSSPQSICSGSTPTALTGSTPGGGDGIAYTYVWVSSTTSATSGFAAASGSNTGLGYSPAALTQSTWYRRVVTSGACAKDTTAAVKITVTNAIASNSITSSPQSICSGSTPTALTGSTPTGGDGTTYTYSWLSSTTSATAGFAVASGTTTAQGYTPASLSVSTWYRRVVTSGACANDTAAAVKITVTNAIATNSITSSPQTICSGSTPTALTGSTPTGGDGSTYTYSWLSSTTSATSGFAVASGTTNAQGYTPAALTQSTWYRRLVTSGSCGADTTAAVKVTVTNAIATNSITSSPQSICSGSTPTALTGSTPTGGDGSTYTYSWLSSTTSATAGFAAASGTTTGQGYTPAALTQNTWFKRVVTSGACAKDTSAALAITVNAAGTWVGSVSSAWNNTANWSCPALPTASTNVTINAGAPNMPVITDAQQANNLTIGTGATLTLNAAASQLSVYGTMTNNGTFTNTNGRLVLAGSSAQMLPAGNYNKLEVNNASGIAIGGVITVNDSLMFTNGTLTLNNNNLVLAGTASTVTGAGATRYIKTNGTGVFTIQNIGSGSRTGAVTFPVGNSTYNPATLTNTGTADNFSVNVIDSVTNSYSGTTPTGASLSSNSVNRTWIINEAVAGGSNATVTLQWGTTDELSGFNRAASYVARYNGSTWLPASGTSASGSNPYTQTRSGFTSFSPFSVASSGTLPVELVSFTGTREANTANLKWITASELNNDHFTLERSTDNRHFEAIAQLKGHGTTALINNYDYRDELSNLVKQGVKTVYYRLIQVDADGTSTESGNISISLEQKNLEGMTITAQPNPFVSDLSLSITSSKAESISIRVLDIAGRLVAEQSAGTVQGNNSIVLPQLNDLKDGVYFINVTTSQGITTHKVVKEH